MFDTQEQDEKALKIAIKTLKQIAKPTVLVGTELVELARAALRTIQDECGELP